MTAENKRGLLIGIPLILAIFAVLVLGLIWWIDSGGKRRSATAPAEIVSVAPTSWRENKTTKNGFRVNYRFNADGQTVAGVDEKNTFYKAGEQFRVCYDPKNPADSSLRSSKGMDCGKTLLF